VTKAFRKRCGIIGTPLSLCHFVTLSLALAFATSTSAAEDPSAVASSAAATATDNGITVTASLDITDRWARVGAYVPVRLTIGNGGGRDLATVQVDNGGPMETVAPVEVAAGGQGEVVVPVFYVGGELTLRITLVDADARRIARIEVTPPSVRAVPADTAIVGVPADDAELSGARLDAVKAATREALGLPNVQVVRIAGGNSDLANQCGLLDAWLDEKMSWVGSRAAQIQMNDDTPQVHKIFPTGVTETVQPQTYRMFDARVWPATDRLRLWLWLGLMAAGALTAGFLIRRRRCFLATGVMLGLAGAATIIILGFGEMRVARLTVARVFHVTASMNIGDVKQECATELLLLLESRGGKTAGFSYFPFGSAPCARPVLISSEDLFRTQGTLTCPAHEDGLEAGVSYNGLDRTGVPVIDFLVDKINAKRDRQQSDAIQARRNIHVESRRPQLLLQILMRIEEPPIGVGGPTATKAGFGMLASRPNFITALYVEATSATDHTGRTQPVDAWAAEWKRSADPNIAYAGRSLKWWADARQEGPGPFIIVWMKDDPPEKVDDGQEHRRMPTMVIYNERPSPN